MTLRIQSLMFRKKDRMTKTKTKTQYKSRLKLDEVYRDKQTHIEGMLVGIYFYEYGCTRATIELVVEGKIEGYSFEEPRLNGTGDFGEQIYESDIQLTKKYRDTLTGRDGVATAIYFYPNSCERVTLEFIHDGEIKDHTFDAPRLVSLETGQQATTVKTGGPGDLASGRGHERRSVPGR